MLDTLIQAVNIVFKPEVLLVMLASSFYGIIIGAIPGLTAVMAVSLIMPIAIFLDPVPALAAIIACDAMAVFAGDIPGTLLRIPGTPASGAYTDDSYKLTQQGKAEMVLGANCFFSAIGGLFGLVVLVCAAPLLAEVALNFSTYEYFWLACLGLTCATFMTSQDKVKGIASLFLGLFITTIGYDSITGQPRFTFGSTELLAGIHVIPVLIGLFVVSEIMRRVSSTTPPAAAYNGRIGNIYKGIFKVWREHIPNFLRGNAIGVVVGALPGAGADIAAWLAYAISKKFSKTPEKFGTGHMEGIIESTSANNSALASAWIPAFVFGIPGDVTTAMVIGILYIKDLKPGPTTFLHHPEVIYSIFICFAIANVFMLILGYFSIKTFRHILRIPPFMLLPVILVFCIVGAFSINNSLFGVAIMLVFGLLGYIMEENDFPISPMLLAIVLGNLLEKNFIISMVKSNGNFMDFFNRPIAGSLAAVAILIWVFPIIRKIYRMAMAKAA
ncbi:tripartite tricarboxylate transporter permease [Cloacibacillus sp.]|uniref:tripartite tricarboxylate transporter permease n=1 Tax=Cloacibacillus sp. TaxID=2049023 RepID=UPI0025BCCE64|nr:tripartite tricarboxylate transporter permease [Cloacibacillus sp.]MCC8057503.1 tripartite tricarboxylate transporter permease [Cloacibacillus sp.]